MTAPPTSLGCMFDPTHIPLPESSPSAPPPQTPSTHYCGQHTSPPSISLGSNEMYPRGNGNSCVEVGQRFIISIYGTEKVFTAVGDCAHVRTCVRDLTQIWTCVRDNNNQFGFINQRTARFLGRDYNNNLLCSAAMLTEMEYLTLIKLSSGGYKLCISVDASLLQVQLKPDSDTMQLVTVGASSLTIGLNQLDEPVFSRFEWVIPERLARSSAPHYVCGDEDQSMDMEAVNFLVRNGITNLISVNTQPLSMRELLLLSCHEITYTHIAVADYHSPNS
ncbi:hypothetical protein BDD12DRAFT_894324 [Trichophaea hybrida]|nr:hypothetical protein BDD12DRAFT_894324 [Trichophaea hybrida]